MRGVVGGLVRSAGILGALALFTGGISLNTSGGGTDTVQAATAIFTVSPPSQTVSEGANSVTVEVMLSDAAGVSSWEFRLSYNPDVLDLDVASADESFLAALPGQYCPSAVKDETAGWVQLGCITSGQNSGKSGSGRVASVTFTPLDAGKSNLIFTKADVSDWLAESLAVTAGSGVIKVAGSGDSNALDPTPTVNPANLTPTNPTGDVPDEIDPNDPNVGPETPRAATPTPRSGTTSSGSSGGSNSGSSGGSVQGSTTSSGVGTTGGAGSSGSGSGSATGAPVAGAGTLEEQAAWPRYALMLAAAGGLALIGGGLWTSRRQRA